MAQRIQTCCFGQQSELAEKRRSHELYLLRFVQQYMKQVFTYAGTLSLSKEMKSVSDVNRLEAGDVFIKGGSPGHAVIVLDVATNANGEKVFLLAQSYMPAQDIHVLVNTNNVSL